MESSNEATQESIALTIVEEIQTVEVIENVTLPEVNEETKAIQAEVQNVEETAPDVQVEPEAKEAAPAKKEAAKPKKTPAATKTGKE